MAEGAVRHGFCWQEFNDWARDIRESTGKRPGVRAIQGWWDANAARVWPNHSARPTFEDAKRHAKGLRSKEAIRAYFRNYRARRKTKLDADRKPAAHKGKSVRRADSDGEYGDDGQAVSSGDEPPVRADSPDDDENDGAGSLERNLADWLQRNRPQRARRAPATYRTGAKAANQSALGSSVSSGSLGEAVDDAGNESDAHGPSDDGDEDIDGTAQPMRIRSWPHKPPRQEPLHQQHEKPQQQQPLPFAAPPSIQEVASAPYNRQPASAGPMATHKASLTLPFEDPRQAAAYTEAAPQAAWGAFDGNPVELLQFLASGGATSLPLGNPMNLLPEMQNLLESPQSDFTQSLPSARNVAEGLPLEIAVAQLGAVYEDVNSQDQPLPGASLRAIERIVSGSPPSGALSSAPPSASLLRRQAFAPLSSVQCANVIGYGTALGGNPPDGCSYRPSTATAQPVAGFINGVTLTAAPHPAAADDPSLRENFSALKRPGPVGGYQPPHKKANETRMASGRFGEAEGTAVPSYLPALKDASSGRTPLVAGDKTLARTAAHRSSLRRASKGASGSANAGTPLPQGPHLRQDAEGSDDDSEDATGTELTSAIQLGSAFNSYKGLDRARQDAGEASWGAGRVSLAGSSAAAVDARMFGRRGSAAAADNFALLGGEAPLGPLGLPPGQTALVHVKQEPEDAGHGSMWVPVGTSFGAAYGSLYGNTYGNAYGPAAAGAAALCHLPNNSDLQLQHLMQIYAQSDPLQMVYMANPAAAVGVRLPVPGAYQAWQGAGFLGGLQASAPVYAGEGGYGNLSGYAAAEGGYGAYGRHTAVSGYGAFGGYIADGGQDAFRGYGAVEIGAALMAAAWSRGAATAYGYAADVYGYPAEGGYGANEGYASRDGRGALGTDPAGNGYGALSGYGRGFPLSGIAGAERGAGVGFR